MARSETSWRLEPTPWSEQIGGDQRTWQSKGPDLLRDAKDAGGMARCLRPGWKSEEEVGGQGGCPVEGQWHRKLKGRQVLRDPGWTCVLFVKTGGANQDI